ncbi:hypothetical protein ACP70R_030092 [Stipagrostis hirtigluma subsp. patula]
MLIPLDRRQPEDPSDTPSPWVMDELVRRRVAALEMLDRDLRLLLRPAGRTDQAAGYGVRQHRRQQQAVAAVRGRSGGGGGLLTADDLLRLDLQRLQDEINIDGESTTPLLERILALAPDDCMEVEEGGATGERTADMHGGGQEQPAPAPAAAPGPFGANGGEVAQARLEEELPRLRLN